MEKTGYIYVLTNESFHRENWIKIGYATDVAKRVKELSNTSVPLPYEVYCTYEIPRINGTKDPDKLLHDLIMSLNPSLRISPNREFFEMQPWDAYELLSAIAKMHGRSDKLVRNSKNVSGNDEETESEYTVEALFPDNTVVRALFDELSSVIKGLDPTLKVHTTRVYVSFRIDKRNVVCLWPKSEQIEVVLNAKLGQLDDKNDLIYDISNRKWSSEQYAFKFSKNTDTEAAKEILRQTIAIKSRDNIVGEEKKHEQ